MEIRIMETQTAFFFRNLNEKSHHTSQQWILPKLEYFVCLPNVHKIKTKFAETKDGPIAYQT